MHFAIVLKQWPQVLGKDKKTSQNAEQIKFVFPKTKIKYLGHQFNSVTIYKNSRAILSLKIPCHFAHRKVRLR